MADTIHEIQRNVSTHMYAVVETLLRTAKLLIHIFFIAECL